MVGHAVRVGPPFPNGEPVTIVRPAFVTDRYNNAAPDWDNASEFTLGGCAIAPGDTTEDTNGREAGLSVDHTLYLTPDVGTGIYGWSVYGQPLTAIRKTDRLRFRGEDHEVVGDVDVWVNPYTGERPGCVVRVTRTEG